MSKSRPLIYVSLAGGLLLSLLPVLWLALTSLKPDAEIARLPPLLPRHPVLSHYFAVFQGRPFGRYLLNSLAVASVTTLLCLLLGAGAAYALARLHLPGRRWLLAGVLMISMFPPIAIVSPLYRLVNLLGLRDSWLALILPYTAFGLPLAIYVLQNFFRELPIELGRAARMDGCTPLGAFWRVMLPLAMPGLVTTGILVFVQAWNEFLFALTFTSSAASRTVPVGIALFPGLQEMPWGDIAAASMLVTLPLLGVVLSFQRRIVAGLTAGAVKG